MKAEEYHAKAVADCLEARHAGNIPCKQCFSEACRAHANEALEKACKAVCPFCAHGKPLKHDPEIGWFHEYPDAPDSDSSCFASAVHALKE